MTINIVSSITVLSVDNKAVIWILLSMDNLDFIAIKNTGSRCKNNLSYKLKNMFSINHVTHYFYDWLGKSTTCLQASVLDAVIRNVKKKVNIDEQER